MRRYQVSERRSNLSKRFKETLHNFRIKTRLTFITRKILLIKIKSNKKAIMRLTHILIIRPYKPIILLLFSTARTIITLTMNGKFIKISTIFRLNRIIKPLLSIASHKSLVRLRQNIICK